MELYRGVALSQGLICIKWVYLGLSKVAFSFIEGCPLIRDGLYEGFHCIEGCPHVRGGLYEGFHCIEGCPHIRGGLL